MDLYQLKISLEHIRPLIWRRIQVPANITLGDLHIILQIVMGWEDCHLHMFIAGKTFYGEPDPMSPSIKDEYRVRLEQIATPGSSLKYEYDFGDSWLHEIRIEKSLAPAKNRPYPLCLAGNRASPPEDCGGPPGYMRLLRILRNPKHSEYEEMLDWFGENFDPKAFDPVEINKALRRLR